MRIKEVFLRFWRSEDEKISVIRDVFVALLAVFIVLLLLWTYTGQWFAAPMVAIESGSMEHPNSPFGRLGTIDAGDMVLVQKIYTRDDIVVHGGKFGGAEKIQDPNYFFYGDWGDVIIYRPLGRNDTSQIIHRAMCWVDVKYYDGVKTYTIEEYGIYNQTSLTIPELGLYNDEPNWVHSGYITMGDHNGIIDQETEICPQPIKLSWISGKARLEIPWIGTINLFFEDILHGKNTVGNVHPDCLTCLAIVIAILISIPIVLDINDYLKQKKERRL